MSDPNYGDTQTGPRAEAEAKPVERVLSGLILGERLSWTGMFERSRLLPAWTRRKRREIEAQGDAEGILETTLPFSLNASPAPFYPGPGAHTEWFIFQLQLAAQTDGSAERALENWQRLAQNTADLRLTLAQQAALTHLRAGRTPPVTGHDNPHYFDDGACFRALAMACWELYAPRPRLETTLLERVTRDAEITNAEDGVWGARAVAAFVGAADQPLAERLQCALDEFPPGSWSSRVAETALAQVGVSKTVFDLSRRLSKLANYAYSYGNAAAETVPAALAILAYSEGDHEKALLAALGVPRQAGSLVPLVGALCGALPGAPVHPGTLESPLFGVALPFLAGRSAKEHLAALGKHERNSSYGPNA